MSYPLSEHAIRIRCPGAGAIFGAALSALVTCAGAAELLADIDERWSSSTATDGVTLDSVVHVSGETSLRLEMSGLEPAEWRRGPVVCVSGQTYLLRAQTRTLLLRTAGLRLFVSWLDEEGAVVEESTTEWIGASTDWTDRELALTAPLGAVSAVVGCRVTKATRWGGQPANEERVAWVDGVAWGRTTDVEIHGGAPGNVFAIGDAVQFRVSASVEAVPVGVRAELSDVWGRRISIAERSPTGRGAAMRFDFGTLPAGHYEVHWHTEAPDGFLPRSEVSSLVVLRPPRPPPARGYGRAVAVDGAFSWAYRDSARLRTAVNLASRLGVSCIRDRFAWSHASPHRDSVDYSRYQMAADLQHDAGLEVFSIFQRTPEWASSAPPGTLRRIAMRYPPLDPLDAYLAARDAAAHFRPQIRYWEIWNEANLPGYFIGRPDVYAALLKASYLGIKAGNPDADVLTCSFTGATPEWAKRVIENGALDYADVYNFHYYGRPRRLADAVERQKDRMRDAGRRLPMWMSENGERVSPDVHGSRAAGELRVAQYLCRAAVTALASGVDRYFWFAFPPIWERAVGPWGLVHQDLTPRASYATLAVLSELLGEARYLGPVEAGPGRAEGLLFDRGDGVATLVAFPESETYLRISGATTDTRIVDIVGNETSMPWSVDSGGVAHVWTNEYALFATNLDTAAYDVSAAQTWPRLNSDRDEPSAPPVWMWADVHGAETEVDPRSLLEPLSAVLVPDSVDALPIRVVVYNMSAEPVDVALSIEADTGLSVELPTPRTVTVPAGGHAEVSGAVAVSDLNPGDERRLRFSGDRVGGRLSPVVVYFARP